jgi:hypothetical protein
MRTIRNMLIGLAIVFTLMILIAFFLPPDKHAEASVLVRAPAFTIYSLVNDFSSWKRWSPWTARDSQMVVTCEGPVSGVGAMVRWTSPDRRTGNGSLKIRDADPYKSIRMELHWMDNDSSEFLWLFSEKPVTWRIDVRNLSLLERYSGLFLQPLMNPYLEQGLDSLRSVSERLASQHPEPYYGYSGSSVFHSFFVHLTL